MLTHSLTQTLPGPGLLPLAVVDGIENPSKAQKQSKEEKALMGSLADTAARLGVGLHVFLGECACCLASFQQRVLL